MSECFLALDVGGTKTLAAVVSSRGDVVTSVSSPTPAADGPTAVLDNAAQLAHRLFARHAQIDRGAVGVGAAGTIDQATGVVRSATDHLPGWTGTDVAGELQRRLGVAVTVDNDVNAAVLGETWVGAAAGHSHALLLAVGTGLGGGLVHDSQPYHGASGAAGEVAHLIVHGAEHLRCGCGAYGHLEAVASGTGLANAYAARTGRQASGADVAVLAAGGDSTAQAVVQHAGHVLGRAIAGLVAVLDCSTVVIAGGAGATVFPYAAPAYREELLPAYRDTPMVVSSLGSHAVVIGAARLAMEAAR